MKSRHLSAAFAAPILVLGTLTALPFSALAEVKSLSSSELTETFIKDSTIIVTPKQQKATRQQTVTSLTISPTDVSESEIEVIKQAEDHMRNADNSFALSEEDERYYKWKRGTKKGLTQDGQEVDEITIPDYDTINPQLPVAEILDDSRFAVPEGDQWARMYAGNQLGVALNGDKFTFSIGNPTGVDPIRIPEAVHNDRVSIVPREGGGLDVTITLPDR